MTLLLLVTRLLTMYIKFQYKLKIFKNIRQHKVWKSSITASEPRESVTYRRQLVGVSSARIVGDTGVDWTRDWLRIYPTVVIRHQ